MEFLKLSEMKKKYYHVEKFGKYEPHKIIDFSMLETCADFSTLPDSLKDDIKKQIANNLVSVSDISFCDYVYDNKRVYIDLNFDLTSVYNDRGSHLYRAYRLRGLRVSVYDSIYYNSMPANFYFIGHYATAINNFIDEYTLEA